MAKKVMVCFILTAALCCFHQTVAARTTAVEAIGRQSVQTALSKLGPKQDGALACITNAGFASYNGMSTKILYDTIPQFAPISIGAGNLLPVHSRWDEPLWFAFIKKAGPGKLLLTLVTITETGPAATAPINVYVTKNQSFEPFKSVLGKKTFSLVTLANGWSDSIPEALMQGALYHDHLCSGVFSGWFTARFIQEHLPVQKGERYIYIGAPGWCQDDYLMNRLNVTPGKHGYYTMAYPWYRPWKTEQKVYAKLGGIVIRYDAEKKKGRACLLQFDWQEAAFKTFVGMPDLKLDWKSQPWLHVLYNRFFLKQIDRPDFFVSILTEKPLTDQHALDRLIMMGSNPLAELLGPDAQWGPGSK